MSGTLDKRKILEIPAFDLAMTVVMIHIRYGKYGNGVFCHRLPRVEISSCRSKICEDAASRSADNTAIRSIFGDKNPMWKPQLEMAAKTHTTVWQSSQQLGRLRLLPSSRWHIDFYRSNGLSSGCNLLSKRENQWNYVAFGQQHLLQIDCHCANGKWQRLNYCGKAWRCSLGNSTHFSCPQRKLIYHLNKQRNLLLSVRTRGM